MDEPVADIIRRLTEWREDRRATFEKLLGAQSTDTPQDLKPDKVTKSMRETLAFYGLGAKYHETMARLSRFFNENSTEEKRANLPEVAWWQKLKKLFEIEESFYKDAKEAFAADSLGDYEIYSGLAKEALDQIQSAIEKVDNPSPVAGPEVGTESAQKRKAWPGPLGKVVEFYFQKEGLILLAAVSLFLGMQMPTNVGSGYPIVERLVSAMFYGFGLYLIYGVCKAAKEVAVESGLSSNWRKYVRVLVAIIATVYGSAFLEAKTNPWTLWKRSWHQDNDVETKNVGRFTTREGCIAQQWKLLNQERSMVNEAEKSTQNLFPDLKTVFIVQGRTIFGFWKSFYVRTPGLRDKLVRDLEKRADLSAFQRQSLLDEYLRPEIVSTVSVFCAPTSSNALWPFNTPSYYVPGEALTDLGERTLAGRAEKILGE